MALFVNSYPILKKETLADRVYSFVVHCPEMAKVSVPGQFVNIKAEGFQLRRPISICEIDAEAGTLRLVFRVEGGGTEALSKLEEGDEMDLLGPLGNGFTLLPPESNVVVVGGGIGVPPMLETAKRYKHVAAALGFQTASAQMLVEDFEKLGAEIALCTDDGSCGTKGFVTAELEPRLQRGSVDMVYACGPAAMLRGVAQLAKRYGVRCEVSLEERMACGVGACLVCACRLVKDGTEYLGHVCKDGPVFPAEQVAF